MADVKIDAQWRKGGFGSVMVADITIKNGSKYTVKDFDIECELTANSGTPLNTVQKTIYEQLKPGAKKTVRDLSMGFINSQAARAGCILKGLQLVN